MTRYRWLYAKWPLELQEIVGALKKKSYVDGSTDGFIIDRVRDDFIESRYVELVKSVETFNDPFGREISFQRESFSECRFRVSLISPGLELIDPPRRTQQFMSRLAEISGFSLSTSSFSLDVLSWASYVQETAGVKAVVDLIQVNNLELARGVTAKAIVKGDKDVREIIDEWVSKKRYNIEKVQLRLEGKYEGTVLLTDSGTAAVDVINREQILICLRESLLNVDKWNGNA